MSTEFPPLHEAKKRAWVRPWSMATVLGIVLVTWFLWPSPESGMDPFALSKADGKPRFYATTYSQIQTPTHLSLRQRLLWTWMNFQRRYRRPNPAAYSFPARPVEPCSISGLLNQCMDLTGTRYLIAVEIVGAVQFGSTNALNGTQWVAAFEQAIETSDPVMCYDYATKCSFQDRLLLIRERRGLVKVVPRSKLADYQKAGLVKASAR